jgi:hypothetical protein
MKRLWRRFINWLEMKREIKSFVESYGAFTMSKENVDRHIEMIKNKYKTKQQEQ